MKLDWLGKHKSIDETSVYDKIISVFSEHEGDIVSLNQRLSGHAQTLSEHSLLLAETQNRYNIQPYHSDLNVVNFIPKSELSGAMDGSSTYDATALLTTLIENSNGTPIIIPSGYTINAINLSLPSNSKLIIDGTLRLVPGAPPESSLIQNSDEINGNDLISITGRGSIHGNKNMQRGSNTWHKLINLNNCTNTYIDIAEAGYNWFPSSVEKHIRGAAIHIVGGSGHIIQVRRLCDYGREGLWLDDVKDSMIRNSVAHGGVDSWSGFQMGGKSSSRNAMFFLRSFNAGASAIGCDSKNSFVAFCFANNPRYFNGFNFGHADKPASGTKVFACKAFKSAAHGFSVVNGSDNFTLIDCSSENAGGSGFNISAGARNVHLVRCDSTGALGTGIRNYGGNIHVSDSNLLGNTKGPYYKGPRSTEIFRNTALLPSEQTTGLSSIENCIPGQGIRIKHNAVFGEEHIIVSPINSSSAKSNPFVSNVAPGYFTVDCVEPPGKGAMIRWTIL